MNIIQNLKIRTKWNKGFEREDEPNEIVIHATGGAGVIKWMETSDERAAQWMAGIALFHYLITLTGEIVEIIDPNKWVYHSSSGIHDKRTIGIEIEKRSADNSDEPTKEQMAALIFLIGFLRKKYNITGIVSHDYNARMYSNRAPKPCPGTLDWEKLPSDIQVNS